LGCGATTKGLTIGRCRRSALFYPSHQKDKKSKKVCKNRTTNIAPPRQSAGGFFFFCDLGGAFFSFLALLRYFLSAKFQNRQTACDIFHAQKGVK
jgi:hypothetical protein